MRWEGVERRFERRWHTGRGCVHRPEADHGSHVTMMCPWCSLPFIGAVVMPQLAAPRSSHTSRRAWTFIGAPTFCSIRVESNAWLDQESSIVFLCSMTQSSPRPRCCAAALVAAALPERCAAAHRPFFHKISLFHDTLWPGCRQGATTASICTKLPARPEGTWPRGD